MDLFVSQRMCAMHVAEDQCAFHDGVALGRWKLTEHVSEDGVNVRLIETDPVATELAKRLHGEFSEDREEFRTLVGEESVLGLEPHRIREVMQRNEWPHLAFANGFENLAIAIDRAAVPSARFRLQSRPLHRDAD